MPNTSDTILAKLPHLSVSELEELVRYHNDAYFQRNAPEISDELFDKLVETLRRKSPDSLMLQQVGSDLLSQASVLHPRPMLSLDKCYDDETLKKWFDKIKGDAIVMPKIDGVACSLHYNRQGHLVLGATRGDGLKGENITANVMRIADVPKTLPVHTIENIITKGENTLEVRGEVHMKLSRFKKLYAESFANPRNLAAGALKQKEAAKSEAYGLSFFPYDVRGTTLATEEEKFGLLKTCGFILPELSKVSTAQEVVDAYHHLAKRRESLDYEVDGIVVRTNLVSEQVRLGETAHHPRFAIAYKFQGDNALTPLVTVEWSVGRTGTITPVAIVKPVFVSGATVSRASLHNLGMMRKLGLKEQALVEIVRRGGVIPHVERVIEASGNPFEVPTHCPSCNGPVHIEGDFLMCANPKGCINIAVMRLKHFCSVVDIQGFGEKLLHTLVEQGLVASPADLYHLTLEDLLPLERMGETLANKLLEHLKSHRKMSLATFVTALGIREIGVTVAEVLAEHFKTLSALQLATKDDVSALHGIGPSIAEALVTGLTEHDEEIKRLLHVIEIMPVLRKTPGDTSHPFYGKSFVFTGKMAKLERKQAQNWVREHGGHTPSSVTSSTDYLVVGDEGSPLLGSAEKSTKQKEAEKLIAKGSQIQIISETDFLHKA